LKFDTLLYQGRRQYKDHDPVLCPPHERITITAISDRYLFVVSLSMFIYTYERICVMLGFRGIRNDIFPSKN
jgi:hypothetical protein